jgi:alkanesulfonate monooxygenase SsuD/methylene tetrahydromethanopterin reductase-like flavin-dependent oxidoreductase (luciferase family)
MRFHITQLTTYHPRLNPPQDVYFQEILEQVALGEELGFECFWLTEHHFIPYGGLVPNPAVMLSAVAARTSRMRVGSAISILPIHHPVKVAEDYAMVDVVSGGRLEFGMGRGNAAPEYGVFGAKPEDSRARFEEAADVVVKAWANERFSHEGTHWQFDGITLYPQTVQRPHPPIWVAGTSVDTMRWAGLHGYDIMTVPHPFPPERIQPTVDAWREGLREAGHDPAQGQNMSHIRVWVDESEARAREVAEAGIKRYEEVSRGRVPLGGVIYSPATYSWDDMRAQGRNIYGTPDQVIAGIHTAARNYGTTILGAQFNYGGISHEAAIKAMRLFAKEVMPAFR